VEFDITDEAAAKTSEYPYLSAAEVQDLMNLFKSIDVNGDGVSDSDELLKFLKGMILNEDAAKGMLESMKPAQDTDGGFKEEGFLKFFNEIRIGVYKETHPDSELEVTDDAFAFSKEFQWLSSAEIQDLMLIFHAHDVDGDGHLDDLGELSEALEWMKVSKDRVEEIKKNMDKDGDGKVDIKEFVGYFSEAKMRNRLGGEPEPAQLDVDDAAITTTEINGKVVVTAKDTPVQGVNKDANANADANAKAKDQTANVNVNPNDHTANANANDQTVVSNNNVKAVGEEEDFKIEDNAVQFAGKYHWLSAAEIQDITNLFQIYDKNKDNHADWKELKEGLKREEFAGMMFD